MVIYRTYHLIESQKSDSSLKRGYCETDCQDLRSVFFTSVALTFVVEPTFVTKPFYASSLSEIIFVLQSATIIQWGQNIRPYFILFLWQVVSIPLAGTLSPNRNSSQSVLDLSPLSQLFC